MTRSTIWLAASALLCHGVPHAAAQEPRPIATADLVRFLTAHGDPRLEVAGTRGRILAAEVGARANAALTELLSQPAKPEAGWLLSRALEAAWYSPIDVPDSILLKFTLMRAGDPPGLDAQTAADLRLRALIALADRPRPQLRRFWEQLWASERDPLFLQVVLAGMACTAPDAVEPWLSGTFRSSLLNEIAARIRGELVKGEDGRLCQGGEATRAEAWSHRPSVPLDLQEAGRAMLRRAGIAR